MKQGSLSLRTPLRVFLLKTAKYTVASIQAEKGEKLPLFMQQEGERRELIALAPSFVFFTFFEAIVSLKVGSKMGRGLRKRGSREGRTFEEQKGKARGRMGLGKKETEKRKGEGVV